MSIITQKFQNTDNRTLAWGILILLCLVWGSSFILIKKGLEAFNPYQLGGLRIVIAAGVLLPFALAKSKKLSRNEWKFIFVVGIIGNGIPAILFPLAETKINSATAGALNTLSPLFVLLLGYLFFQFVFTPRQVLGVIIGLGGALLLILTGGGEIDLASNTLYASFVILATIGYGLSTNIMKRHLNHTPSVLASGYALLSVSLPYGIYLLFFSGIKDVFETHPSAWTAFGYIIILGAFGTALALVLFYRLVQLTSPLFSASVTYFIPIVALSWGILDGEVFTLLQYLSMLIILAGVYLANKKQV